MRVAAVAGLLLSLGSGGVPAGQMDTRIKGFATVNDLPDSDALAEFAGSPAYDANLDLRLLWRQRIGAWELLADHTTIALAGDTFEFNQANRGAIDQTPTDDDARALELTWTLERGDRHRVYHRFDRLALRYRGDSWGLTVGREAVSWGSGKVFNPMDLFSPFAPTTVDRDYKAGDDLVLINKLFRSGDDLQLLGVFRRDADGDRDADAGSFGGKWRRLMGDVEVELAAGRHYRDNIAAVSLRFPIGGALLQSDWVVTELDREDDWKLSGVVNIDYSFTLAERTAYVYAEYYRNGFGEDNKPVDLSSLPVHLSDRLQRGEVFTLMKDYGAIGGLFRWHPLLTQSLTALWNLQDGSALLQTNLSFEPGDRQRLEAGITLTAGDRGEEYGRIDVGEGFSVGGGSRLFLRWLYFW